MLLISRLLVTGCENNRENAKDNVKQANQYMMDVQAQTEKEWQQFDIDAKSKIDANQKNLDDFKEAMKKTSTKFKAKYENKVLTLEQKNIELKKQLNEYQYKGKDNWEKFKPRFNNNLDSVENTLKSIFEKKD